jgi:hypothetical protein
MANQRQKSQVAQSSSANDSSRPKSRVSDDIIRNRAYEIYERRGGENGRDWDDWFQAERELIPNREQDDD